MKKKKATKKDIEIVVSNLINHLQGVEQKVDALDNIFGMFIKYKEDEKGFQEYELGLFYNKHPIHVHSIFLIFSLRS